MWGLCRGWITMVWVTRKVAEKQQYPTVRITCRCSAVVKMYWSLWISNDSLWMEVFRVYFSLSRLHVKHSYFNVVKVQKVIWFSVKPFKQLKTVPASLLDTFWNVKFLFEPCLNFFLFKQNAKMSMHVTYTSSWSWCCLTAGGRQNGYSRPMGRGGPEYDSCSSFMSSELESTSCFDSEDDDATSRSDIMCSSSACCSQWEQSFLFEECIWKFSWRVLAEIRTT